MISLFNFLELVDVYEFRESSDEEGLGFLGESQFDKAGFSGTAVFSYFPQHKTNHAFSFNNLYVFFAFLDFVDVFEFQDNNSDTSGGEFLSVAVKCSASTCIRCFNTRLFECFAA